MERKNLLDRRSFLISAGVCAGGIAVAAGFLEKSLQAAVNPAQLTALINQKVTDTAMKNQLLTVSGRLGQFKDPSIVASWGLGCGVDCAGNNKRWSDTPSPERVKAINAAKLAPTDREMLLSINTTMETISMSKGELVGAWGLGCGAGCARTMQQVGLTRTR
jgi:hypothetical protein